MVRLPKLSLKSRLARFWDEDRGLSALLAFLAVIAFIVAPLAETTRGGGTVLRACVSLMFAFGAYVLSPRRRDRLVVALLAAAPILLGWMEYVRPAPLWQAAAALSSCLFALTLAAFVTLRVFQEGPITIHRVVGSIAVYLMIGIAFAEAARCVRIVDPGAYASASFSRIDRPELYYFSLVTLSTVGYGDITPVHPFARSLAVLEALIGQLFPAILIARLVSQELMGHHARRPEPGSRRPEPDD
ncbi:MAG TPA: potassium channel family protein [Candidatus Polarisedimenticolia bacterium]|nr:potassium channel family protein [Candidatus Polarisedimenticolia bacterium]